MNQYEREQLEIFLLAVLFRKPWYLNMFVFNDTDFSPLNRKCLELMTQIGKDIYHDEGRKANFLVDNGVDLNSVLKLSSLEIETMAITCNPKEFVNFCHKLREQTVKEIIETKARNIKNPEELKALSEEIEAKEQVNKAENFERYVFDEYSKVYEERQQRLKSKGSVGVVSGFDRFDEKVGMRPPELITLGARTSIGKTAFALNIAYQAAMFGQKVLYINLEMASEQITDRLFALISGKPITGFYFAKNDFLRYKNEINILGQNLFFFTGIISSDEIIRKFHNVNPDLIIVDYLNLLSDKPEKGESEVYRTGRKIDNLKKLATSKKCSILLLAQLNRTSEGKGDNLDLTAFRDSGFIEQQSDTCLLLHRDRDKESTTLKIAKRRNGKSNEDITYMFKFETGKFTEELH